MKNKWIIWLLQGDFLVAENGRSLKIWVSKNTQFLIVVYVFVKSDTD